MTVQIDLSSVTPGFADPVLDAQSTFRKVLLAMSEPGTLVNLDHGEAPDGLNIASAAIALTLIDYDTPVWLSPSLVSDALTGWLRFHCGCPIVADPLEAAFAIVASTDGATDPNLFHAGDPKYPDRSTTILYQIDSLADGAPMTLEGPGIPETRLIAPKGLSPDFWSQRAEAVSAFQLGVDIMLTAKESLIGLPRTTRLANPQSQGAH